MLSGCLRMHMLLLCSFCLLAVLSQPGCESAVATRKRLVGEATKTTTAITDVLVTVKDEATAKAAAPKLEPLVDRLERTSAQLDEVDLALENEFHMASEKELEKFGQWMAEHSRLMQEELRVAQIPGATAALGEPWQRLTGGIFDPGGPMAPGGVMGMGAGQPAP